MNMNDILCSRLMCNLPRFKNAVPAITLLMGAGDFSRPTKPAAGHFAHPTASQGMSADCAVPHQQAQYILAASPLRSEEVSCWRIAAAGD
jgi:hypothetical protein